LETFFRLKVVKVFSKVINHQQSIKNNKALSMRQGLVVCNKIYCSPRARCYSSSAAAKLLWSFAHRRPWGGPAGLRHWQI